MLCSEERKGSFLHTFPDSSIQPCLGDLRLISGGGTEQTGKTWKGYRAGEGWGSCPVKVRRQVGLRPNE